MSGGRLVLFRSFGIPPDMAQAWPVSDRELEAALRAQAETYLEECAAKVPNELPVEVRVALGIPWQAICKVALDEKADLIVIGSHGYSGIDHVLGTTAAR